MKKYLGASINIYAAIVAPLLAFGLPVWFAFVALSSKISAATVFIALMCASCVIIWSIYIKQVSNQLYSWGTFDSEGVEVKTWFSKSYKLLYKECNGCGIGFYTHGVLNSPLGTKMYYIFLSYESFDEDFRYNINLWRPSKTRIKAGFSKKLYNYLLEVLPKSQSAKLQKDYEKYFGKNKTGDGSLS